ncbi:Alanine dehydrogenase [bacterium HR29]|nr:Alanine dehydrogenase [bacterium HR29]
MRIGCPKERKPGETRVALTPASVGALIADGHAVVMERGAGQASGYPDAAYAAVGAELADASRVWEADLVVKVKEPLPEEFPLISSRTLLFGFLHLAANRPLAERLTASGATAFAFELVRAPDGSLPLLAPMSQIAGRLAAEVGVHLLKQPGPGRGILVGGVAGVPPGRCVIVGSGTVATAAARALLGLDAAVTMLSVDLGRLRALYEQYDGRLATRYASPTALAESFSGADLAVLAPHVPGAAAPKVVTRAMVRSMGPGAVLVDVAIDQGGASETSRPTTLAEPTYVEEGVVHYCVPNMPAAVPRTSTLALAEAALPAIRRLARLGPEAAANDVELGPALVVRRGRIVHPSVAEALGVTAP